MSFSFFSPEPPDPDPDEYTEWVKTLKLVLAFISTMLVGMILQQIMPIF